MRILAGDIGGTKTAIALYDGARLIERKVFASNAHSSLHDVLDRFMGATKQRVDVAAFGVAGPVEAGVCAATNLPWLISERELADWIGAPTSLINDFHAVALGVRELPESSLCIVQDAKVDPFGPYAVIGPGTGLGEAVGVPTPTGLRVLPGEGGHVDFAPRNEDEIRLLQFLLGLHTRVSIERVVSGRGLAELYDFVLRDHGFADDPAVRARFEHESAGAVIADLAEQGDVAASKTLDLFVSLYGAEAGNLALKVLPTGGLYLAGGISPKQRERILSGAFMQSFLAKGRVSKILESVRVAIVLDQDVGLVGARAQAAVLLQDRAQR